MKSKSFTKACRFRCSPERIRKYCKLNRSRKERRYVHINLNLINTYFDYIEFDIIPKSEFKSGHAAWDII